MEKYNLHIVEQERGDGREELPQRERVSRSEVNYWKKQ